MTDMNVKLGAWLKQKRTEKGMTLQQVADKLGVNRSTIQRYEKANLQLYASTLIDLCKIYDADLAEFIGEYHAGIQRQ